MLDLIIALILFVIVGFAVVYVIKAKKSGRKCIGCPSGGCSGNSGACSCSCSCCEEKGEE